ncbi:MAG: hypothetical protein HYZ20_06755 [Burkholderiales bacterium]|nr:hypothetical protein [Burkholderiales bacterium]
MERLMHETKETFLTLLVVSCLIAGIGGAVFYTVGPDGWLVGMVRDLSQAPSLASFAALAGVIGAAVGAKRWLDRHPHSAINNLLVGVLALGGLAAIVHGLRGLL